MLSCLVKFCFCVIFTYLDTYKMLWVTLAYSKETYLNIYKMLFVAMAYFKEVMVHSMGIKTKPPKTCAVFLPLECI